jgi:hypothetical protein
LIYEIIQFVTVFCQGMVGAVGRKGEKGIKGAQVS